MGIDNKNRIVLMSFINYCASHPDERFWQALRNWVRVPTIAVIKRDEASGFDHVTDTFLWEGHRS